MTIHDVERAFTVKLGAERDPSGHHIFFYLKHAGRDYTVGKLSRSWHGHLNDSQVMMLARKLFLQKTEFEQFVDCQLSAASLIQEWQDRRSL